jgi:transmembrane sensor
VDDLILRVLTGAASPFEAERLRRWRGESPSHEAHFQEMLRVWDLTTPEAPSTVAEPPALEDILARAASLPEAATFLRRPIRRWAPWRGWGLLAASVAALALGIRGLGFGGPDPLATYRAAPGQTLTANLSDGSFVRLAGGSILREWDGGEEREVSLEGAGFFAVARDPARPFVVRTASGQVRVLGTRFELKEEGRAFRTVVVEGRVLVSNDGGAMEVTAGQVALVHPDAPPSSATAEDVYALLDWPGGTLVFQGTPLAQVAAEVTREYSRPLTVIGEELAARRITAWFQGESFDEVAESLCLAAGASCRVTEEGVTMALVPDTGPGR